MHLLWRFPWFLPVAMTGWNVLYVAYGVFVEYRIKATALRYMVMYATTIPAALRGDLEPFFAVLTMPSE